MFENSIHYLSFADRNILEQAVDDYDSIIVNAQVVAGGQGQVPVFIQQLIEDNDIEYYINPQIPEFRVGDNFRKSSGNLRQYTQKLVEVHGNPIEHHLSNNSNLKYSGLADSEIQSVCEAVIDFQQDFVYVKVNEATGKYETPETHLRPKAVIPWYIKIDEHEDIARNKDIIERSLVYSQEPVKPCLFFTKRFLRDATNRTGMAAMLEELDIENAFVWPEDFDKSEVTTSQYLHLIDLVEKLSDRGISPHMMYANYFGHLLGYFGMSGVGFGKFYLESKYEKTENTGGGGGNKRYYFDPVKCFLNISDVHDLANSADADCCGCSVCSQQMDDWDDIFKIANEAVDLQHNFVSVRDKHRQAILTENLQIQLEKLEEATSEFKSRLEEKETTKNAYHLKKWQTAIEHHVEEELDTEISEFDGGLQNIVHYS